MTIELIDKETKLKILGQAELGHREIVICTGGFDPLHSGHIDYLKAAMYSGSFVAVGLNSDDWLARKKGRAFMPFQERKTVHENLYCTDVVFGFDDSDDTAKNAIRKIRELCPENRINFLNGGDRTKENIPEMDIEDENLQFIFDVGGAEKKNSSSWILQEWKNPKTERQWGYYRVLHDYAYSTVTKSEKVLYRKHVKVKELTINPNSSISFQKHLNRNELWFVVEGNPTVYLSDEPNLKEAKQTRYSLHETIFVPKEKYHRIANQTVNPVKIVEIQYGSSCDEDDIERIQYD